jgi:hypothetical protein
LGAKAVAAAVEDNTTSFAFAYGLQRDALSRCLKRRGAHHVARIEVPQHSSRTRIDRLEGILKILGKTLTRADRLLFFGDDSESFLPAGNKPRSAAPGRWS